MPTRPERSPVDRADLIGGRVFESLRWTLKIPETTVILVIWEVGHVAV